MDAQRGIARRMVLGLPAEGLSAAWERDFSAYPPAGVIVFRRDFQDLDDLRRLTARLRALARPRRLFIGIDEEGGHVSQLAGHFVVPPNALLLGRGAAPGEIAWASEVTGRRLRALGVDWVFAPVADVHSEPANPVIGPRAYGTEPAETAARVAEALRGFAAAGIGSCLKHFPGHGATALDSHLAQPVCDANRATLESRELVPFATHMVGEGTNGAPRADAVMTAHVVYPALDPECAATFSPATLRDLLRGALGFDGVCITDALEMKGASGERGLFEAARLALAAGSDLLLFATHDDNVRRVRLELARALVDGAIDREGFDLARPRLARFDRERPEPGDAELAAPIGSLTPPDWEERLERIVSRGLMARGVPPVAPARWRIEEPAYAHGRPMRDDLAALGMALQTEGDPAGPAPVGRIAVAASRTPLDEAEIERLRGLCRSGPTVLVGLQNDAFLDQLPEAALRLSAADATPLTRRVVARELARALGARG